MSISTRPLPPPPQKKRGLGCLGCGCVVLALIFILFLGLVGSAIYAGYRTSVGLTSETPPVIPASTGTDELYQSTRQKLADFAHDVKNHQAATVKLSADEVNTLISHTPDITRNNIHAYVTFTGSEGRVQASVPSDDLSYGLIKGRYLSLDTSFEVHFDAQTKMVNLIPHTLQLGDKVLVGPNADNDQGSRAFMSSFTPAFNQSFNGGIRKNPDGAALLDQAKSITIEDGELVIQTQ
jgi:hypothetical protein